MSDVDKKPNGKLLQGILIILVAVAGLGSIITSNGGGGGGGSTPPPPTVNYDLLPTTLLAMSTSLTDTSVTDAASREVYTVARSQLESISPLAELAFTFIDSFPNSGSYPYSCPGGGTETVTVNLATQGMVSIGDVYRVSYTSCVISGVTFNGSLSMTVVNIGALNDTFSSYEQRLVGAELSFDNNNLALSDASGYGVLDGDETLSAEDSLGYIRFMLTGDSLAMASNTQTARITNYSFQIGTDATPEDHFSFNFDYASNTLGGIIQVATTTEFIRNPADNYPYAGALTITGDAGKGVRITAQDAINIILGYEFNGDGNFIDYQSPGLWSDLDVTTLTGVYNLSATTPGNITIQGPASSPHTVLKKLFGK